MMRDDTSIVSVTRGAPSFSVVATPARPSSAEPGSSTSRGYLSPYLEPPATHHTSIDSTFSEFSFSSEDLGQSSDHDSPPASHTWRERLHRLWLSNQGVLLVLISQIFATGMTVTTRVLELNGSHGPGMNPFQILFVRQFVTGACSLAYMSYAHTPDAPWGAPAARKLLVSRGIFGLFGVCGMYFSLEYLPLSEATVLTFLAPVLTCYVCSFLMEGEVFTRQQQAAAFLSLAGVVCIARPAAVFTSSASTTSPSTVEDVVPTITTQNATTSTMAADFGTSAIVGASSNASAVPVANGQSNTTPHQHLLGIALSLMGVVGAIGAYTSIRLLGPSTPPLISVTYFSLTCLFVSLVACAFPSFTGVSFRLPGNASEWLLLVVLGICGFVMQVLLTVGLTHGSGGGGGGGGGGESSGSDASRSRRRQGNGNNQDSERRRGNGSGNGTKATSMLYSQMLFALVADRLIWGESPGLWSWLGSGLIMASAVWVTVAKNPQDNKAEGGKNARGQDVRLKTIRSKERKENGEGLGRGEGKVPEEDEDEEERIGLLRDEENGDREEFELGGRSTDAH